MDKQTERRRVTMYGIKRQPPNPLWVWNTYTNQPDVLLKLLTPPKPPPDPIVIKPNTPPPHVARTLFPEPTEPVDYPGQIRPKYKMINPPITPIKSVIPSPKNKEPSPPNKKHTLTAEEEHLLQLLDQEPFDYETTPKKVKTDSDFESAVLQLRGESPIVKTPVSSKKTKQTKLNFSKGKSNSIENTVIAVQESVGEKELWDMLSSEPFSWGITFEDGSSNFRPPKKHTTSIIKTIGFFFGEINKTIIVGVNAEFVSKLLLQCLTTNYTYNAQGQLKTLLLHGELSMDTMYSTTLIDNTLDTLIAVYLLDPDRGDKNVKNKELDFGNLLEVYGLKLEVEGLARFQADLQLNYQLINILKEKLTENELVSPFIQQELPLVPVLCRMEMLGIGLDKEYLMKDHASLEALSKRLQQQANDIIGYEMTLNSPPQILKAFEELRIPLPSKSTNEEVLSEVKHPLAGIILRYRKCKKLMSTYISSLAKKAEPTQDGTHRIHCTWLLTDIATGRIQSVAPSLQNVVRGVKKVAESEESSILINIRDAFVARPGYTFVSADYESMEMRLLAVAAKETRLIEFFNKQTANDDFFKFVGGMWKGKDPSEINDKERNRTKTVVYACVYGSGPKAIGKKLDCTVQEAKDMLNSFFHKFKQIRDFMNDTIAKAKRLHYVASLSKRKRMLPHINSEDPEVRASAERQAVNSIIQGTGADIIKASMLKLHNEIHNRNLCKGGGLVLSIHDELLFEVPEAEVEEMAVLVKECMENICPFLTVPLKVAVKTGKRWGSLSPVNM